MTGTFADQPDIPKIVNVIRNLALSTVSDFPGVVEKVLERELCNLPVGDRLTFVDEIAKSFKGPVATQPVVPGIPPAQSARLLSLLLGKGVVASDLSSDEISARLAKTLSTVFDTMNQIVAVINSTLMGREGEQETIRHLISSEVKGEAASTSLQNYLDQIQEAFLIAHKASSIAAEAMVTQILSELDPGKMEASSSGLLKFGVLRRAELFKIYQERFAACKKAFESGRLMEGFLREFEKACMSLYKTNVRRRP